MGILFVGLLLVATATALPVPDANLVARPPATFGSPEEKFVPLPPPLPPLHPCDLCPGGENPPFKIVGEINGNFGHPLYVVDLNVSDEDFSSPSDEYGEEDYFSGEFDPDAVAAYCAQFPETPECSDGFEPQPPRVFAPINTVAPGKPQIPVPALKPSLLPTGSTTQILPLSPVQVSNVNQLNPVDSLPVPLTPVDAVPLIPSEPLPLNPVDSLPLPLTPVDPNPLNPISVDPLPLNPVDATPLIPLETLPPNSVVLPTKTPLEVGTEEPFQDFINGSFVFPQDSSVLSPLDSSAAAVADPLSVDGVAETITGVDKRFGSKS